MANYKNIELKIPPEMTLDVTSTASVIMQETDWTQIPNSGLTDDCVTAFKNYRTVTNAFSTSNYCVAESLAGSSAVACTYNNYTTNTSTAYKIGNRRVETTAFHDAKRANEAFFGDLA